MTDLSNLIARLPLLQGLSHEVLVEVIKASQTCRMNQGKLIVVAHQVPSHLIMVLRGQLQTQDVSEDGKTVAVSFANPGDVVGLLSMIDGQPIASNVTSSTTTDLLLIPLATARDLIFTQPVMIERVMTLLAAHIRKLYEERRMLTLPNAFQRVFAQIATLSQQAAGNHNPVAALPKQHDIALMVNTSRETVSRALQMLVKKGILVKDGHKIVIRKPEQLKQLADHGPEAPQGAADSNA